jgi:hypothetical protein
MEMGGTEGRESKTAGHWDISLLPRVQPEEAFTWPMNVAAFGAPSNLQRVGKDKMFPPCVLIPGSKPACAAPDLG